MGIEYFWAGAELGGLDSIPIDSAGFVARMGSIWEMSQTRRVALMCSEGHPKDCHRGMKLTAFLHQQGMKGIFHIMPNGSMMDSRVFQDSKPKKWLWVSFEGGTRGQ